MRIATKNTTLVNSRGRRGAKQLMRVVLETDVPQCGSGTASQLGVASRTESDSGSGSIEPPDPTCNRGELVVVHDPAGVCQIDGNQANAGRICWVQPRPLTSNEFDIVSVGGECCESGSESESESGVDPEDCVITIQETRYFPDGNCHVVQARTKSVTNVGNCLREQVTDWFEIARIADCRCCESEAESDSESESAPCCESTLEAQLFGPYPYGMEWLSYPSRVSFNRSFQFVFYFSGLSGPGGSKIKIYTQGTPITIDSAPGAVGISHPTANEWIISYGDAAVGTRIVDLTIGNGSTHPTDCLYFTIAGGVFPPLGSPEGNVGLLYDVWECESEPPLGKCCKEGICSVTTQAECNAIGGTWTEGADCSGPFPCPGGGGD